MPLDLYGCIQLRAWKLHGWPSGQSKVFMSQAQRRLAESCQAHGRPQPGDASYGRDLSKCTLTHVLRGSNMQAAFPPNVHRSEKMGLASDRHGCSTMLLAAKLISWDRNLFTSRSQGPTAPQQQRWLKLIRPCQYRNANSKCRPLHAQACQNALCLQTCMAAARSYGLPGT